MKKNLISIINIPFLLFTMAISFSSLNGGIKDKLKDLKNLGSIKKERDNLRQENKTLKKKLQSSTDAQISLQEKNSALIKNIIKEQRILTSLRKDKIAFIAQHNKDIIALRAKYNKVNNRLQSIDPKLIAKRKKSAEQARKRRGNAFISSTEHFLKEETVMRFGDYVEPPLAKAVNFIGAINFLDSKIETVDIKNQAIAEISNSKITSVDKSPNLFFRKTGFPNATILSKFTSLGRLNLASLSTPWERHFTLDNQSVYDYKQLPADANYNFIIVFHPKGTTNIKEMLQEGSNARNNPAFDLPFDIVHENDFDITNYQNK